MSAERPQTTPIGMPPATVLPYTTMSARTPKNSCAPPGASRNPVYTSSKIRGTPHSSHTARSSWSHRA